MKKLSILDIILFPKGVYQRITEKKLTLYLGILFVGIVDIIFFVANRYSRFFEGKTQGVMAYNLILVCMLVVVIGFLDVIFFSYPLFDFMKILKKQPPTTDNNSMIMKVMKIYITVHFLVIPFNALFFYLFRNVDYKTISDYLLVIIMLIDGLLIPVWFSAAIVRGFNTLYHLEPILKRLVFFAVFSWNYLLGIIFDYIRESWILALFK